MNRLIAFVATAKPDESRAFYRQTPFSLVFLSDQSMVRVQRVAEVAPASDTALGWEVDDLEGRMAELTARGVAFEHFDGFVQDPAGLWIAPDGTRVAWFRDPDGNILSLTQFGA